MSGCQGTYRLFQDRRTGESVNAIRAPKKAIEAYKKEDPKFCQFLLETGRLVEKDEKTLGSDNAINHRNEN